MAGSTPVLRSYGVGPAATHVSRARRAPGPRSCHPSAMNATVRDAAASAGNSRVVEMGARLGYAASGLLHVLMAWVALQLAWGSGTGAADQNGALQTLAGSAVGSALLWATVVGFVLLAIWQVTEAVARHDVKERVKSVSRAVLYLVLAWTAFTVVQGAGGGQGTSTTASLMGSTGGRLLIGAGGLVVVGVGVYHVAKGWRSSFLRDLTEHPGTWLVRAGRVGYVAKGVALVLVGGLLTSAAATADPAQPQGFDAALRTLLELPLGKIALTLVALGLAAYGVYSFGRARYARV
ncbi:MAG: hypothetical protein JWP95_770 [Actinotalea sp.]|nr:hypothetical protein [Actinotalea sp.]